MLRNLLLDWSGTLVDDLPPVISATNFVLEQHGRPPLDREEFRRHFRLPFEDFYDEFLPGVSLGALEELFHRKFVELQGDVTPLPGLGEFLDFCRASGRRLFLLSSMKSEHFEAQAEKLGILHCFERPYAGVRDKRIKIREILATHGLAPEETAFVGDMIHDIEAARHGGVMSIAILTGYDTIEKLALARPDVVVSSLSDLRRLLSDRGANAAGRITLAGLEVYARIGVTDDERSAAQRLEVNLTLDTDLRDVRDDIARTTDYAAVAECVTAYCAASNFRLLEALAGGLADALLEQFPLVAALDVEVRKFILPNARHTSVRLRRERD